MLEIGFMLHISLPLAYAYHTCDYGICIELIIYANLVPASVTQLSMQYVFLIWPVKEHTMSYQPYATQLIFWRVVKKLKSQLSRIQLSGWKETGQSYLNTLVLMQTTCLGCPRHFSQCLTFSSPQLSLVTSTKQQNTMTLLLCTSSSPLLSKKKWHLVSKIGRIHRGAWQMNHHNHQRAFGNNISVPKTVQKGNEVAFSNSIYLISKPRNN